MASIINVFFATTIALIVWGVVGMAAGRVIGWARPLTLALAPALGWAVHTAAALPIALLTGFNRGTVALFGALSLAASASILWRWRATQDDAVKIPVWALAGAVLLAFGPAAAILPKFSDGAVFLSSQIFDHAKVAMIDEMTRLGLPPGNPFFGEDGQASRLAYYYLLHFSAAELSLLLGINGWEADAALTWFTNSASLSLMIGLAVWLSGRRLAAVLVLLISATGSLRPLIGTIPNIESFIERQSGFAGWLFQSAWVPQHMAAASCVVLAALLMSELARRESLALLAIFVLVVVAGFESSAWVGGVTFAAAAIWIGTVLLAEAPASQRFAILGRFALAAACAALLAAPMLYDQATSLSPRGGGSPVALQTYQVLGPAFSSVLRQWLDIPAFWLILLVVELPAIYISGVIAMRLLPPTLDEHRARAARILIHLAAASLAVAWLMVSTMADNNDLGWRAVLCASLVLSIFAAAGLAQWIAQGRRRLAALGFVAIGLALPNGITTLAYDVIGSRDTPGEAFAATPPMWTAVRRHAAPDERIANNPAFLAEMTPWPVNISWALMSNRRSCFAGYDLALPFVPLPRPRLRAIEAQFTRVFSGEGWPEDLRDLAARYGCRVAVVTALDGAWTRDSFATSEHWHLVESNSQGWRIYRAGPVAVAQRP